jgi:hypothetical protein
VAAELEPAVRGEAATGVAWSSLKFDPVGRQWFDRLKGQAGAFRGAQGVGRELSCIGPKAATEAGRVGSFGLRVDYATVRSGLGSVSLKQFASRSRSLTKGVDETDGD